eukprot:Skav210122  [mRNA]  locus=scaffold2194:192528:194704:+ [translate_table: standard]
MSHLRCSTLSLCSQRLCSVPHLLHVASWGPLHPGYTPLDWARHHGHNQVAQILEAALSPKGSQKVRSFYQLSGGQTPLHWAAISGRAKVVRLLLEHRASPQTRDNFDGKTPLDEAREKGHTEVVQILEAAGGRSRPPRPVLGKGKGKGW